MHIPCLTLLHLCAYSIPSNLPQPKGREKADACILDRQNNALLNSLSQKTNALKSVTVDIYDNARDQQTIDNTVSFAFPLLGCARIISMADDIGDAFTLQGTFLLTIIEK